MAIGSVLGSGVLVLPAITADFAGPASLIAWVSMALLSIPMALTLGRLGTLHPHAGGIAAYARTAFGPFAGRMVGWLFLGTIPLGVPIVALVGAGYVGNAAHLSAWTVVGLAAVMLATSIWLNVRGIELAGWVQVFAVLLILALLITAILTAVPHVHATSFHPFAPHGWWNVGIASVAIFWSFVGWEMISHLAEEFRNPTKDLRITFTLSPIIVGVLYVALAFVTIGDHAYGTHSNVAPLSDLVRSGLGQGGADVTAILALFITFGAVHTNIAGFSRLLFAQARSGDFPALFTRLHPRYRTPVVALAALAVDFAVVLLIYAFFHVNLGSFMAWPSVIFLVLYMTAMAAAMKLLPRFRLGWWQAALALLVCMGLYSFSKWASLYPPTLVALGSLIHWISERRRLFTAGHEGKDENRGTQAL